MGKSARAVALLITLVANVACADPGLAEDPVWGKQPCAHCKMLVSDPHFAAQLTTKDGKRSFFDDPGCLVLEQARLGAKVQGMWMRDPSGKWIDARKAMYRQGAKTPMNYGFVVDEHGKSDFEAVKRAILGAKTP